MALIAVVTFVAVAVSVGVASDRTSCSPVEEQYGQCGSKDAVIKTSLHVTRDCDVTITARWRNLPAEVETGGSAVWNVLQVDGIATNYVQELQSDLDGSFTWVFHLNPTPDKHTLTAYTQVFTSVVLETTKPWPTKHAFCAATP